MTKNKKELDFLNKIMDQQTRDKILNDFILPMFKDIYIKYYYFFIYFNIVIITILILQIFIIISIKKK